MATAIDHAADTNKISNLVSGDVASHGGDSTDDLVPRYLGVRNRPPLPPHGMQVGVADAAEQDVDLDVVRADVSAVEGPGGQGARRIVSGYSSCRDHLLNVTPRPHVFHW